MDVKKYIFGDNLIYEIENLNIEVYKTLSNMVNTETSLLKVSDEDFSSLCNGYKKLMIGFGKISELNNLLNLFDVYKESERMILTIKTKENNPKLVLDTIRDIKQYFLNIDIIYSVDICDDDYDVIIYIPIIKDQKEYWKCPRCNTINLKDVMYCTLCKREQPF